MREDDNNGAVSGNKLTYLSSPPLETMLVCRLRMLDTDYIFKQHSFVKDILRKEIHTRTHKTHVSSTFIAVGKLVGELVLIIVVGSYVGKSKKMSIGIVQDARGKSATHKFHSQVGI